VGSPVSYCEAINDFGNTSVGMAPRPRSAPKRKARRAVRTGTRADWIAAARAELISGGVAAIKVGRLAKRLAMTRGAFYWHFTSLRDLLLELLHSWELTNTVPFERALSSTDGRNGVSELIKIVGMYLDETDYSPVFDIAVRDWARVSKEAAIAVRRVDQRRVEVLHRIFLHLNYADPEALVRARILYLQQTAYYTIDFQESPQQRRELIPIYTKVLAGITIDPQLDLGLPAAKKTGTHTRAPRGAGRKASRRRQE
jgi:AcrR family transcriptional regulator